MQDHIEGTKLTGLEKMQKLMGLLVKPGGQAAQSEHITGGEAADKVSTGNWEKRVLATA